MRYEMRNSLKEYSFVSIQGDKADYESWNDRDKGNNNVERDNDEIRLVVQAVFPWKKR